MSVVTLTSGGLDSTVMSILIRDEGIQQFPLFINYGQRNLTRELRSCQTQMKRLGLAQAEVLRLGDFGLHISSGLTDRKKRLVADAFLPCRNLLFLVTAAAYAVERKADAVALGLLDEGTCLFADQTSSFLLKAEEAIKEGLGRRIRITTPLREFLKADVVELARTLNVSGTYSCHRGGAQPCGKCISCREFQGMGT